PSPYPPLAELASPLPPYPPPYPPPPPPLPALLLFFFTPAPPPELHTLSLHDALPIFWSGWCSPPATAASMKPPSAACTMRCSPRWPARRASPPHPGRAGKASGFRRCAPAPPESAGLPKAGH